MRDFDRILVILVLLIFVFFFRNKGCCILRVKCRIVVSDWLVMYLVVFRRVRVLLMELGRGVWFMGFLLGFWFFLFYIGLLVIKILGFVRLFLG